MDILISADESSRLDRISSEEYLIPSLSLMESAARLLYEDIRGDIASARKVTFLCASGNNGGDAIACARMAWCDGFRNIGIYYHGGRESGLFTIQRKAAEALGIPVRTIIEGDLIIDGLYGVGLKGSVREEGKALIRQVNSLKSKVIAIDVPSGCGDGSDGSEIIHCVRTVTFGFRKLAMYMKSARAAAGEIRVYNPSFAPVEVRPAAWLATARDYDVPPLRSSDYKNSRGHIAIFGSSPDYPGAVRLATRAAFKAGAGLVTVFTSPEVVSVAALDSPSAMVRPFSAYDEGKRYDAVLFGPGIGSGQGELLRKLLSAYDGTLVLDADGIRTFADIYSPSLEIRPSLIFTPHPGELRYLLSSLLPASSFNTPLSILATLAELSQLLSDAVIISKSDVVAVVKSGETPVIYDGSNPAMGVAGSGDVLAGITAAFAAKGLPAVQAVILHQMAGARAGRELGFFTSEELIEEVGRAR